MTDCERLLSCFTNQTIEWQTSCRERAFLLGMAALLHPKIALEIGVWYGGFTRHLIEYCEKLISIDPVNYYKSLPNEVYFLQITSDDFFKQEESLQFDLIILDADHSTDCAYRDLKNCINHGKFILMHDSFNPGCRAGYEKAICEMQGKIYYQNLDMVQGDIFEGAPWGGIGLVVTL
jgi:hypothetical protein